MTQVQNRQWAVPIESNALTLPPPPSFPHPPPILPPPSHILPPSSPQPPPPHPPLTVLSVITGIFTMYVQSPQ